PLGGEVGAVCELEDPRAPELGHLLLARHPPEEVLDALVARPRRVAVQRLGALDRERHPAASSGRQEPRTTSLVGSIVCSGTVSLAINRMSSRAASYPICWIGCSIVVSGGSPRADSGTLSKPITDRSSGTESPSSRATEIVVSAVTSFAAKIAVGRSSRSSS